jgi:trk system potassium uptake protein TrkH
VEARGVVGLIVASCFGVALYVWLEGTYEDYPTALRHVSFNLVSMATDCGFASQDFDKWPVFAPCGCCSCQHHRSSGSTGGGIKMIRTLILAKQANRELTRLVHPPSSTGQGRRQRSPTTWSSRCSASSSCTS